MCSQICVCMPTSLTNIQRRTSPRLWPKSSAHTRTNLWTHGNFAFDMQGRKRSVSIMSGILVHIHATKHNISRSDCKILSTGVSVADLLVRGSPDISKLNPVVNANIGSTSLDLFQSCFVANNYNYIFANISLAD